MSKMCKYRFKTKAEFVKEFGENWKELVCFNPQGKMDYLLGTVVTKKIEFFGGGHMKDFGIMDNISGYRWIISQNMITSIVINPSYDRKTFIYD